MKHETYLKQFIRLVIAGNSVESCLRASLAKETIVKARNGRRHLCNRGREGVFHPCLIVEPKLLEKKGQFHYRASTTRLTFMAPLRDDTSTSPIMYASLTANMKLRSNEPEM